MWLAVAMARVPVTALLAASLGISAIWLSLLERHTGVAVGPGVSIEGALLVAACAGSVAALNYRAISALTLLGLVLHPLAQSLTALDRAEIAPILVVLPPMLLLVLSLMERPIASVQLPARSWAMLPLAIVGAFMATQRVEAGSIGWYILLPMGAILVSFGGFAATRAITGEDTIGSARHVLRDRRWLNDTARYLLLGRISSGLSHELSQSLNVITMANGNLGYILDRANIAEPHGQQLAERVRRIAGNANSAAQVLGQFRWFGQDGGREGSDLSVGSALFNAVSATRAAARKSGVSIEIRGDALNHALPLRHGTIEMLTTAALLEIVEMLAARTGDSRLVEGIEPEVIMIEATVRETQIEIAVLCPGAAAMRQPGDDIAEASYELLMKLAVNCGCDLRRVDRRNDPVRFILRLDRDMA
jgi:hypothetical protein